MLKFISRDRGYFKTPLLIFATILTLLAATSVRADTNTATWSMPIDGNWLDASKWAIDTYPDNTIDTEYDVVIDVTGGPYTMWLNDTIEINSLLIGELGTNLNLGGGSLTGNLRISEGLTLTGGRIYLKNNSSIVLDGNRTISGHGEIIFNGGRLYAKKILTIDSGIVVRTDTGNGIIGNELYPFINNGTISAQTDGQSITLHGNNWVNNGVLEAKDGGRLSLEGSTTTENFGTINVTSGGRMTFNGTLDNSNQVFTLDDPTGAFELLGSSSHTKPKGTIKGGTIVTENDAKLYIIGEFVTLDGIKLNGEVCLNNPLSNHQTILDIKNGIELDNGRITLAGNEDTYDKYARMRFTGVQKISGVGEVVLGGSTLWENNNIIVEDGQLTIGPNVTVRTDTGGGTIQCSRIGIWFNEGLIHATTPGATLRLEDTWTNRGEITIDDGTLYIDGRWANFGEININGGTTYLDGQFSTIGMGTINHTAGEGYFWGELNNNDATISLDSVFGSFNLGGRIRGGTITGRPEQELSISYRSGNHLPVLDGVTLNADVRITDDGLLTIENGLTLGTGNTIILGGDKQIGYLQFNGNQTLDGGGTIVFNNYCYEYYILRSFSESGIRPYLGDLTIGPDILIQTEKGDGILGHPNHKVFNHGTISSQTSKRNITLEGHNINYGTWEAKNEGILILKDDWVNHGIIKVEGGTVELHGQFTTAELGTITGNGGNGRIIMKGDLDNTNDTFIIDGNVGSMELAFGSIRGGTITSINGGILECYKGSKNTWSSTLDDVTLATELVVIYTTKIDVKNQLVLDGGRINFRYGGTPQLGGRDGAFELLGDGEIVFNGFNSDSALISANKISSGVFIHSGKGGGQIGAGNVINEGFISSQTEGRTVKLIGSSLVNHGKLQAVYGGILNVDIPVFTNDGILFTDSASSINIFGDLIQTDAACLINQLSESGAGILEINGDLTLDGSLEISVLGEFMPASGSVFTILSFDGSRTGTFNQIINNTGYDWLDFEPVYDDTNGQIRVTVIPEPASVSLLLIGSLILGVRQRTK